MTVDSSWYPSGRFPWISRKRLSLAGQRRVTGFIGRGLYDDIVDESRLADAHGQRDQGLALDLLHRLQRLGIDDRDVLDARALHLADQALHLGGDLRRG